MTPDIFHIRYLFHLLNFIGFSRCIREAGDTRAPHTANHLRQPPLIRKGSLSEVTLRRPLWPYRMVRMLFGALALGSDPLRRKLRPLWGGSLDFQAFAASLSSRIQCLCAFRDILGGQSQCLCGFPGTRTNGHEWVQQASNPLFIRAPRKIRC